MVDRIAAAVDGCDKLMDEIEEVMPEVTEWADWAKAIGLVHDASRRIYKQERRMLDYATNEARRTHPKETPDEDTTAATP